jgi:hypothetical protein
LAALRVLRHPFKEKPMSTNFLQSGVSIIALALTLSACAMTPAVAPSSAIDPPGAERAMTLVASGVQTYVCKLDAQHHPEWVFRSPQATLYDASGRAVVTHSAGPSWKAEDGSRIVGHAISQWPSSTKASIPQLLLETHSTGGNGILSSVRYVQRVNTVGGLMPSQACSTADEVGSSPYLAEYVFYK